MSGSSAGQIVGGIVGAVIGTFVSPGYGTVQGFAIGYGLGGVVDPPDGPKLKAPPDKQLEYQSSAYGTEKPDFYGTVITSGNVIYFENNKLLRTVRTEEQGGKGGGGGAEVEIVTYYGTWAVALGNARPGAKLKRLWLGDKIIYDTSSFATNPLYDPNNYSGWDYVAAIALSLQASWQANRYKFDFYDGTQTTPNARLASVVGADRAESYNGTMYIMLYDIDMTDYGNSITGAQLRAEIECDPLDEPVLLSRDETTWPNDGTKLQGRFQGVTRENVTFLGPNWDNTYPYSSTYEAIEFDGGRLRRSSKGTTGGTDVPPNGIGDSVSYYPKTVIAWGSTPPSNFAYATGQLQIRGKYRVGFWLSTIYAAPNTEYTPSGASITPSEAPYCVGVTISGSIYSVGASHIILFENDLSSELLKVAHNIPLGGASGPSHVKIWIDDVIYVGYCSTGATARLDTFYKFDPVTLAPLGSFAIDTPPACQLSEFAVYDGILTLCLYQANDTVAVERWQISGVSASGESLPAVVQSVVQRSGIEPADIDTTELVGETVQALASNGGTRGTLGTLQLAHLFDIIEDGYGLRCVKRQDRAPVATIPETDLIQQQDGMTLDIQREMDGQLPSRYTLAFRDMDREQNTAVAIADYPAVSRLEETIEVPMGLTQERGNQLADIIIRARHIERYSFAFMLPQKYLGLQPSDVVEVETADKSYLIRITAIEENGDQSLNVGGKLSAPSLYESSAVAGDSGYIPPLVEFVGDTEFTALDVPMIYIEQDTYGFLTALNGASAAGWQGGTLLKSADGGQTFATAVASTAEATTGEAINALSAHPSTRIDRDSTLTLFIDTGSVSSTAIDNMLRNTNIAAYGADGRWEIIGFVDAVEDSDGQTHLTTLARGLYGTEWATGLHQAGDQFVMLDISATPFATLAPEGLNAERVYRPVTFGQSPADVANVPYTYQGENLRPRAPAGVIAGNTGNDLTLAIVGRTRYPTSFWTSGLEPQNEPVVRYEVDVLNGPTVLRTLTDVGGVVTYTEADQITDWGSAVTTADAVVYQMSDRVGRGHPLYTSFNYTTITYALFDPAQKYSSMVLSGDNSTVSEAGGAWRSAYLDTTKTTGKWYYEFLCGGVSGVHGVGVSRTGSEVYSSWCGSTVDGWMYFGSDGGIWHNNTKLRTVGTTYATGDVIGVALDADTGDIWFSKNGTWITGDPSTGTDPAATITGGDYRPGVSAYNGGSMTVRSAPGETAYPAPLGFNDGLIK